MDIKVDFRGYRYPKMIIEALKWHLGKIMRIKTLTPLVKQAEKLKKKYGADFERCEIAVDQLWGDDITIQVSVKNIKQALPIIRDLRANGWKIKDVSDSPGYLGQGGSHIYTFETLGSTWRDPKMVLDVALITSDKGGECKFVGAGFKEVEPQPIYKLVCGDKPVDEMEGIEDETKQVENA